MIANRAIRFPLVKWMFIILVFSQCHRNEQPPIQPIANGRTYYISPDGNDASDGSLLAPWKTLQPIASTDFEAGDSILLKGGCEYIGSIHLDAADSGMVDAPVVIGSYGHQKAIILSKDKEAFVVNNAKHLIINNIECIGLGRKTGNTTNGLVLSHSKHVEINQVGISGYQKAGLLIYKCAYIAATHVVSKDNGYAGIEVSGAGVSKLENRNIVLSYCTVENNAGDPTNFTNHSGNGIIAGQCTQLSIQYCTAFNNGWDMPRTGNGPVGIWAWDADSITIEHCLSYRNKTSVGGADGGGFDLDGGVTNSVIQYCLSYENQGGGYGLFQYKGAGQWSNNIVRFNISINDGWISGARSGLYVWSAMPDNPLLDCKIYNNTIINEKFAAIGFAPYTSFRGFVFSNNILMAKSEILRGNYTQADFYGNNWWSMLSGFKVESFTDFSTWRAQRNKELLNNIATGINIDPLFANFDYTQITKADQLNQIAQFIPAEPACQTSGIDLMNQLGYNTGNKDFFGNTPPAKGIGAAF